MSDLHWTDAVDRSPLLSVVSVGTTAEHAGVTAEFIAIERRVLGGVVIIAIKDDTGRDPGEGPLNQGRPFIQVVSQKKHLELQLVASDFIDLTRIRYRAVFRPGLSTGADAEVVIDHFEAGILADLSGPWRSGVVSVT